MLLVRQYGNDDIYDFTSLVDAVAAVENKFGDKLHDRRGQRVKGSGGALLSRMDSRKAKVAKYIQGASPSPAALTAWRHKVTSGAKVKMGQVVPFRSRPSATSSCDLAVETCETPDK